MKPQIDEQLRGGWYRAWNGRLIHYFYDGRITLCGKELVPHDARDRHDAGYQRRRKCAKCSAEYELIAATC